MHAPRTTHLHIVKRIFRYLQCPLQFGLQLRRASSPSVIVANLDTDWAGYKDSCRSMIGYSVFFGPYLISWCSKKQPTISMSSAEVEHRAIAYTVAKTIWICKLLSNPGIHLSSPIKVYCDNISASYIAINPAQHDCSKHIAVDYHFVHEHVAHRDLVVCYIPTKFQTADIFTKGLSSKFDFFKDNLLIDSSLHISHPNG